MQRECNQEIIRLIESRMEKGRLQYGHGLLQNAGYDWIKEALEEALDGCIYLAAKLIEIEDKIRVASQSETELSKSV